MSEAPARTVALVGPGRAGRTVLRGLVATGWRVAAVAGRAPDRPGVVDAARHFGAPAVGVAEVAADADLVVIATPDAAIAAVAETLVPGVAASTLVLHLSGSLGLDVLEELPCRIAALHPLQTMPDAEAPHDRLRGASCAVAGDPQAEVIARELGMQPFSVRDPDRAAYHAAACVAANHLVALLAQVEACTDVPLDAFLPLVRATVDNVAALGPAAALTGPVARGDVDTVRRHLAAIPEGEREAYRAVARRAAVLAGRSSEFDGVLA